MSAAVWLAIERTCHEVTIRRVGGMYRGEPHEQDVQAACRCGWRGPPRPAVKAETWAARDGRKHLAEVDARTPPSGWPDRAP
jgi:hypothetical protein